jgi:serine/threonine protein kinase
MAPALCNALIELHGAMDAPIIHRDVKPSNVVVVPTGVVLIDLGIARSWHEDAERDTTRFGTPGYAPPEQYGFGQTGVTGDIYAAGMTIAFCCTGQDPTATLREEGFTDPRIPAMLRPILVKATQLDPAARYQSAIEMKEAIRLAISGRRPAAETPTKGPRPSAPQSIPQDGRAHAVAIAPHAEAPFKRMLKYLWNATVMALYLFVVGVVAATVFQLITSPPPETLEAMQAHPGRFVLAVIELMVIFAMTTLGAYLALFKMHLRQVKPFCRFSWQQELPAGIGIIAFAALLIHIVNLFVTAS